MFHFQTPWTGNVVELQCNDRRLVRRDGWTSEHPAQIRWNPFERNPGNESALFARRLESSVSHDERVRFPVRQQCSGPLFQPATLAVHVGPQNTAQMRWETAIVPHTRLQRNLGDGGESIGVQRRHVCDGGLVPSEFNSK